MKIRQLECIVGNGPFIVQCGNVVMPLVNLLYAVREGERVLLVTTKGEQVFAKEAAQDAAGTLFVEGS